MKILSLFTGIGAFEKALKNIGIDFELVGFSEIDKYAIKSYCAIHNVDESLNLGDITKIEKEKLPRFIDLIIHGSPCQDFSVAGKQAGGDKGSETRSSLMWNTVDIIEWCLPKYVIWENVKNLLSKKHRHNFDSYIEIMDKLGYNSYYQVLNAKDYGIPQNRERVYTISIRKDIDKSTFKFPEKEELKLRLKDMLEDKVDEKYYLSNYLVSKYIPNNTSNTNVIGNLIMDKWQDNMKRIYDIEKYSPAINTMQGGNLEPKILEEDIINPLKGKSGMSWQFEQNVYAEESKCLRSIKAGGGSGNIPKIITHNFIQKVKVRKYNVDTERLVEILKNAKIKKNITNKELSKKLNIPQTQVEHYFRKDKSFAIPSPDIWLKLKDILNITTDEFDKSIMTFEEKEGVYDKANRIYDDEGLAPTLTQQEEKILIKNATKKGYDEAIDGDSINLQYPNSKTRRGRVGHQVSQTLMANDSIGVVDSNIKIRKLTPKECWRLMGFIDEDFERAASVPTSNTQLYKQAGNSIVVPVLEKIFLNLLDKE